MRYRFFLVNCYLRHGGIQSQTQADRDRSIYYLQWRFSDSLKWLGESYELQTVQPVQSAKILRLYFVKKNPRFTRKTLASLAPLLQQLTGNNSDNDAPNVAKFFVESHLDFYQLLHSMNISYFKLTSWRYHCETFGCGSPRRIFKEYQRFT